MNMELLQGIKHDLWKKGYPLVKGLDFDETFAPIAMLLTIFLSFIKWTSRVLS
jgi:hypothetical protein